MPSRTDSAVMPAMRELLLRGGFDIRSTSRADCAYCTGRSRGTVAYTDALAFCHRCHWKTHRVELARLLGLLRTDFEAHRKLRQQMRHRQAIESTLASFECWHETRLGEITNRYRVFGRQAALARQVLAHWPDCDPAWSALARYYHNEAKLCAMIDWLAFTKASVWLQHDSTPLEVFSAWRATHGTS
jgi:hypothetical protein